MKIRIHPVLSALAATIASTLFLFIAADTSKLSALHTLFLYFLLVLILWAPSNYFYALALRHSSPASVYIVFGVCTAIFDIIAGTLVFRQYPNNPWLLLAGFIFGSIVIISYGVSGDERSDLKQDNRVREYILYVITGMFLLSGYLTHNVIVQIAAYCSADFCGAVLISKLTSRFKGQSPLFQDWFGGLIGLAPAMLAGIILLSNIKNISIVGPVTAVASAAVALPGTVIFFENKINFLKTFMFLTAGGVSIWLIFLAF